MRGDDKYFFLFLFLSTQYIQRSLFTLALNTDSLWGCTEYYSINKSGRPYPGDMLSWEGVVTGTPEQLCSKCALCYTRHGCGIGSGPTAWELRKLEDVPMPREKCAVLCFPSYGETARNQSRARPGYCDAVEKSGTLSLMPALGLLTLQSQGVKVTHCVSGITGDSCLGR